jgi:hypothetical protein
MFDVERLRSALPAVVQNAENRKEMESGFEPDIADQLATIEYLVPTKSFFQAGPAGKTAIRTNTIF